MFTTNISTNDVDTEFDSGVDLNFFDGDAFDFVTGPSADEMPGGPQAYQGPQHTPSAMQTGGGATPDNGTDDLGDTSDRPDRDSDEYELVTELPPVPPPVEETEEAERIDESDNITGQVADEMRVQEILNRMDDPENGGPDMSMDEAEGIVRGLFEGSDPLIQPGTDDGGSGGETRYVGDEEITFQNPDAEELPQSLPSVDPTDFTNPLDNPGTDDGWLA